MAERVAITEVGPRDGLQNEPDWIPTERKVALIERLIAAGLRHFEATSFVSPRAVPQLRDAAEVVTALRHHAPAVELTALVPNRLGAERAVDAGVGAMVVIMSASESHNLKNVNRSRRASLEGFQEVANLAAHRGIPVHGAIATSFGCPFEGVVPVEAVVEIASSYYAMGVRRISLGDTTGMATPPLVSALVRALRAELPEVELALHFHNTRGVGLVCVQTGLSEGVRRFESSIGGLGGCPFVPNATGNIATEDLVYLLEESGFTTGIDLDRLIAAAAEAEAMVGRTLPGQVMKAGPRLRLHPLEAARTAHG